MQQILNFTISIFDVRTKLSVKIKDDNTLVRNIKIQKSTSLDNSATITFAKDRSYKLLGIEEQMKLYNYVKIELTLKNYNPTNITDENPEGDKFYFSGFIQNINKQVVYGTSPSASVSVTIVDFANLFKTTFYTKNLTFVQILQQAVPEFRLINFEEIFEDPKNRLLNSFYSLNQMGFIFFSFFFFKFLYNIVYEKPGEVKKAGEDPIFKQFKLFMPFGFDMVKKDDSKIESMFKSQVSSLIIYKHLQGVALDLFKYVYPEPIFEFTTHETADSVILQIRLTPFMSFARPQHGSIKLNYGNKIVGSRDAGAGGSYNQRELPLEGSVSSIDDYRVINEEDFGHSRIATMLQETQDLTTTHIREHLYPIMTTMNETLKESRKLDVDTFIPDNAECELLTNLYFKEIDFDIRFLETISMTRTSQNVVNVIWTVPTTDTAVLQSSGRALVYGLLQQKLNELGGGSDQFSQYIATQFLENKQPNPAFLWNYKDMYPGKYVSGDLNFFGFREFEIKWNCLTVYDSSVYQVLNFVDRKTLEEIRTASNDSKFMAIRNKAVEDNVQKIDSNSKDNKKKMLNNAAPMKKIGVFYEQAFNDPDFKAATARLGFDAKTLESMKAKDIAAFILKSKDTGAAAIGAFVAKLNGIIARSYRENEHLYDCQILTPINLSIFPGMIVRSEYPDLEQYNSPRFKGYVTGITHTIDFNNASMKSNFTLNRTALEDSGLVIK